ncbi:hypothetical protein [Streptomyces sp. NPDC058861]|uniref:hypothetical protein n=1 Tax=Streptomyces sp. NPDC058861 TaxID=3346653 RepID=UPI0036A92FF3
MKSIDERVPEPLYEGYIPDAEVGHYIAGHDRSARQFLEEEQERYLLQPALARRIQEAAAGEGGLESQVLERQSVSYETASLLSRLTFIEPLQRPSQRVNVSVELTRV